MYLSDGRCNSSSAKAGVLMAITGNGPTASEGGTHYHRQRESPSHYYTHQGSENQFTFRWLLLLVLVVSCSGTFFVEKTVIGDVHRIFLSCKLFHNINIYSHTFYISKTVLHLTEHVLCMNHLILLTERWIDCGGPIP
ncbi:hypothetical protein AVEN_32524-1 [Araneus ventricosus]|uniref:Uncharacterized protein n=1 Tax=Araneus ventricosus TaxID=182803 RepID=A0A4Y2G832_ARAVE|nr:hypothetical protein AVEN_32524-1 [Araneus ventricosus]